MKEQDFIQKICGCAMSGMKENGILASVTIAQAILESSCGQDIPLKMRGGKQKKDVIQQYGMESDMAVEMRQMIHQMDCNVPLEQLLEDFAERSRIEDVEQFAGIFSYAKRSGGDFTAIMGNTVRQMADRMELQETIETALTARKMEQKVMNVIPLFILAFVNVTSGSFLEALYGNVAGVLIMTGCLILYGLAYLWSEKIVRRIGESIC